METISKAAFVAFALGTVVVAGHADAQTIVRFPAKGGVPITVKQAEPKVAARSQVHTVRIAKRAAPRATKTADQAALIR